MTFYFVQRVTVSLLHDRSALSQHQGLSHISHFYYSFFVRVSFVSHFCGNFRKQFRKKVKKKIQNKTQQRNGSSVESKCTVRTATISVNHFNFVSHFLRNVIFFSSFTENKHKTLSIGPARQKKSSVSSFWLMMINDIRPYSIVQ